MARLPFLVQQPLLSIGLRVRHHACCWISALQVPAPTFCTSKQFQGSPKIFIGHVQVCLLDATQEEWLASRGLEHLVL